MSTAIYIIWALIPTFFFLMALWSWLEKTTGKRAHERPGDLFRQGIFVGFCVLLSLGIDHYFLPSVVEQVVGDSVPYGVFQMVLLPVVLVIAAKLIGPSNPIRIEKAPTSSSKSRSTGSTRAKS